MARNWIEILEVARIMAPREGDHLTALELGKVAKLQDAKTAAAWLVKFANWGYVKRIGTEPGLGKKPRTVFTLTSYGLSVKPKASHKERLESLIESVNVYRDLRGKPAEGQAWKDLLKTNREIEEGLQKEDEARNS